jgi:altronate dehydratase small subunit
MTLPSTTVRTAPDARVVRALILHGEDSVATLLDEGRTDDQCALQGAVVRTLRLCEPVPYGHKVSVVSMKKGDHVVKYGHVIGVITSDTGPGRLVHIHNVASRRGVKKSFVEVPSDRVIASRA